MTKKDKVTEYLRYNKKSFDEIDIAEEVIEKSGSEAIPYPLRAPYIYYEKLIEDQVVKAKTKILDLCCGNGIHTLFAAKCGGVVTATDIAENSIILAKMRAIKSNLSIDFLVSDTEELPFDDISFDVVTCAGSLSYVDISIFTKQIKRVLRPEGKLIIVDSFDHNIIYRMNRFIHYLRGKRSFSTLERMPSNRTLKFLKEEFSDMEVRYFGIFSFFGPILSKLFDERRAKSIIDNLDQRFSFLRRYSFKIVIIATK